MISRWNFTQWPSHLSGARGGLLLFLPKLSDFSFANCSRAMFHKSTDYGNDMMVVQFLICFSLSCMHDFPIFVVSLPCLEEYRSRKIVVDFFNVHCIYGYS